MSIKIQGSTSGNIAEVDSNNHLKVINPLTEVDAGFTVMSSSVDEGTITGDRITRSPEVSPDFRLRVGVDNMIFNEGFPGSNINTGLWKQDLNAMTVSNASGFFTMNIGGSNTLSASAMIRTYRHFPCYKQYTTYFEAEVKFSATPITNNRCEWGLFIASGQAAPTDGVFFRLNSDGTFNGVVNFNGVEVTSDPIDVSLIGGANITKKYLIYLGSTEAFFWINNILVARIDRPAGNGGLTLSGNLPAAFRVHNVGTTASPMAMSVGNINVTWGDQSTNKPWGHILAGTGAHCTQGQTGATLGSTAQMSGAAIAAGAALSQTTAAAQFVGLGGHFAVTPTLTAGTDGILCSFLVPLGTAALPGRSLYITGCRVSSAVTTALTGGPVIYGFSLAYGHNAISLATTESAITKAPRRFPLGMQSYAAAAPIATSQPNAEADFEDCPILVQPGEYVQVVARNYGTVTSAGVITFVVSFSGFWE